MSRPAVVRADANRKVEHPPVILGTSRSHLRALASLERYARAGLPVLLVGATGTGKELFARYAHWLSGRAGEFVDLDCGALPGPMAESLLFGHVRGAFTGADSDAEGLVARADQGTLFLDELASLPLENQAKLLRLLETGEIRRLGETRKRVISFGVVAAIQEDMVDRLADGRLRRDLYQRLAVGIVRLPALAERTDDIWLLAEQFVEGLGCRLTVECRPVLEQYSWPGNVRELRSSLQRAASLTNDGVIQPDEMAEAIDALAGPEHSTVLARRDLFAICERNDWQPDTIARVLRVSRATLYRRLRAAGIALLEHRMYHTISRNTPPPLLRSDR